jgi:hypothetical protein
VVKSQQALLFRFVETKYTGPKKQLTGCGAYILKEDEVWSIELLTRSGEKQVRGEEHCLHLIVRTRPHISGLPGFRLHHCPQRRGGNGDGEGGKTLKIASRRVTLNHCV